MSRALPTALLAALALALAGCGGNGSNAAAVAGEVAQIVPADAKVVVSLETDPESEQWRRAEALLDRFPGKATLFEELHEELSSEGISFDEDLLAAVGDETYLVVLAGEHGEPGEAVVLTRPRDRAKLDELLREEDEPAYTREVDGWTVVAEAEQALAAFGTEGDRLADEEWFGDAQARVEGDALVTLLANGELLDDARNAAGECEPEQEATLDYVVGTVGAEEDGVRLRFAASGDGAEDALGDGSLLEHVPSGAIAYFGAPGFDAAGLGLADQLRCALDEGGAPNAEGLLGISYEDVLDLFAGGFALTVRPAALGPEVTLLLEPEDDARAIELLDSLVERGGRFFGVEARARRVGDLDAREVTIGPVRILYGAGDGRVVVTSAESGFDALTGDGGSLEDDESFRDAVDAAGAGDATVLAWVDLARVLELVSAAAALADEEVPAGVRANLEPLESLVVWGELDDPNQPEIGAFLAVR